MNFLLPSTRDLGHRNTRGKWSVSSNRVRLEMDFSMKFSLLERVNLQLIVRSHRQTCCCHAIEQERKHILYSRYFVRNGSRSGGMAWVQGNSSSRLGFEQESKAVPITMPFEDNTVSSFFVLVDLLIYT